jgi:succinoglycan biosynthesis transport protein ExoP
MVALAILLCVVGAGAFSLMQPKAYAASVKLLVPTGNLAHAQSQMDATGAASSYGQLAVTAPGVRAAIAASGVLGTGVSATAQTDGASPFLEITVQASTPVVAQAVANAYIQVLPQVVVELEKNAKSTPQFTVLQTASLPTTPSAPRPVRNALIGAALGLILGLATALLREALDGRLRDGVALERAAGVTLLGLVPKEFRSVPVPAMSRPKSRRAEAYRAVRTNLEFLPADGMPHSIVITSASSGEGKSSLSANLGIAASRAGRDVVIIDADLRKPSAAAYFGLDSPIGLTDVLTGRWSMDEALQQIPGERLCVLASGPLPAAPGELVGSAGMAALIEDLEQRFDLVIIDTPPILPVSDGLSLAVNVDGVVLVAKMRETTRRSVQKAAEALRKINAPLVGVVGNVAVANGEDAIYGYGDGYRSRAKLHKGEAAELAEEIQPLEAAGRRFRQVPEPQEPEPASRPRRERHRAEARPPSPNGMNGNYSPQFTTGPETNPRGINGLLNVDLRPTDLRPTDLPRATTLPPMESVIPESAAPADQYALRPRPRRFQATDPDETRRR